MSAGNAIGISGTPSSVSAYAALAATGVVTGNVIGTTAVAFGRSAPDPVGVTIVANNSFTVLNPGLHQVELYWSHFGAVQSNAKFMGIYKNGVLVLEVECAQGLAANANWRELKVPVNCAANDSIDVRVRVTAVTNITFSGLTMTICK